MRSSIWIKEPQQGATGSVKQEGFIVTFFSEKELQAAAKEVSLAWVNSLPPAEECRHVFSLRFQREMSRLIQGEKPQRTFLTGQKKIMRTVACIALAAILLFASVMATSVQAREWVLRWLMEWNPTHVSFIATESAKSDEVMCWEPSWLPEGYTQTEIDTEGGLAVAVYESSANDSPIYLEYMLAQEGLGFHVDNEWHTLTNIEINNMPGQRLDSTRGETNMVLWFDEESQYSFLLSSHIETDVLVAVAESVCLVDEFSLRAKKLEPSFLPDGYEQSVRENLLHGLYIAYSNGDNFYDIHFWRLKKAKGSGFSLDNEWHTVTDITINGLPGKRFDTTDGDQNMVLWFDEENQYSFLLSGRVETDTLVAVAESVSLVE